MSNIYSPQIMAESQQFIGAQNWYKNPFGILYTDGVQWIAETLNCYWLINDIALYSRKIRDFPNQYPFLAVDFMAPEEGKGKLLVGDGNDKVLFSKRYSFADLMIENEAFKAVKETPSIRFFLCHDGGANRYVLMLPTEY